MAFVNLSITTDLKQMRANVLTKVGTLNGQESGLIDVQIDNIIHDAIIQVRTVLGKWVDKAYSTTETVTEASNLIVVSTIDMYDHNRVLLFDATHGRIPILSDARFFSMRSLYSTAQLANAVFARISNILATDNKMQLETFRGSNKTTPGTLSLVYPRNPKKATADADKVDLPDAFIPIATDAAALAAMKVLSRTAPEEMQGRVNAFLQSKLQTYGIEVSPARN